MTDSRHQILQAFKLLAKNLTQRLLSTSRAPPQAQLDTSAETSYQTADRRQRPPTVASKSSCSPQFDARCVLTRAKRLVRRTKDPYLPRHAKVQDAIELSFLLATHYGSDNAKDAIGQIEQSSSIIISLLSTESVIRPPLEGSKVHQSLCQLAVSPKFRIKMVKRRCSMLALARQLSCPDRVTRGAVLIACSQFLDDDDCRSILSRGDRENIEFLCDEIVFTAWSQRDSHFQLMIISILQGLIQIVEGSTGDFMDVFQHFAYNGASNDVKVQAAMALSNWVDSHADTHYEYMRAVADFMTSSSPNLRREALAALETTIASPHGINNILKRTDFVKNSAELLQHGSNEDRHDVLNILRQLARSSLYHENLLEDGNLMHAIVSMAISEDVRHCGTAKGYAQEIALSLLSNECNTDVMLSFKQLEPLIRTIPMQVRRVDEMCGEQLSSLISKLDCGA